ncbi:MAG: Uncharacterised protein [Marine Group II euryarchaeote MED-G33]|nr:MAG: Uncharacterised protein [Marine Group II euryarchaeote MED-G33]
MVAEMLTFRTPGRRCVARFALAAQSGQSMPLMGHSKVWTPSISRDRFSSTVIVLFSTSSTRGLRRSLTASTWTEMPLVNLVNRSLNATF